MSSRILWFVWMLLPVGPVAALDIEDTRHLLDRTGFGTRPEVVEIFSPLDRAAAIERVLGATAAPPPVAEWAEDRPLPDPRRLEGLTPEEREALRRVENRERNERMLAVKAWWSRSMPASEAPLIERMTLFWHNHWPCS